MREAQRDEERVIGRILPRRRLALLPQGTNGMSAIAVISCSPFFYFTIACCECHLITLKIVAQDTILDRYSMLSPFARMLRANVAELASVIQFARHHMLLVLISVALALQHDLPSLEIMSSVYQSARDLHSNTIHCFHQQR